MIRSGKVCRSSGFFGNERRNWIESSTIEVGADRSTWSVGSVRSHGAEASIESMFESIEEVSIVAVCYSRSDVLAGVTRWGSNRTFSTVLRSCLARGEEDASTGERIWPIPRCHQERAAKCGSHHWHQSKLRRRWSREGHHLRNRRPWLAGWVASSIA